MKTNIPLARKLRRISRWSLVLLVCGLPFFSGGVTVAGGLFSRLLTIFIAGSWVLSMVLQGKLSLARTGLEIPAGLFFLLVIGLSLVSVYRYASLVMLAEWGMYLIVFLASANLFGSRYWPRLLAGAIIATGGILSVFGLLQYAGAIGHSWWCSSALSSTYVNKNHFAGLLIMIIPLTLGFCISIRKIWQCLLSVYFFGLMLLALSLTFSKAGWGSLFISLGVTALFLRYKPGYFRRWGVVMLVGTEIFFLLAMICWKPLSGYMLEEAWREVAGGWAGLSVRIKMWGVAKNMLFSRPYFGYGPGIFPYMAPGFRPAGLDYLLDYAHNDLLQLGAELGFVGLMIVGYCLVSFFWSAFLYLKRCPDHNWGLRWGAVSGLLALLINSLVDFQFHLPANATLWFALAGLVAGAPRN